MDFVRRHGTTAQLAREKIDRLLPAMLRMYGDSFTDSVIEWKGDALRFSGKAMGLGIRGAVRVTDSELILRLDGAPFFAKGSVRQALDRWFDENWPDTNQEESDR